MSIFRLSVMGDAGEEKAGRRLCADAEGGASVSGKESRARPHRALSVLGRRDEGVTNKTKYEFGFERNRAAWSC